jgi:hypothetical protein
MNLFDPEERDLILALGALISSRYNQSLDTPSGRADFVGDTSPRRADEVGGKIKKTRQTHWGVGRHPAGVNTTECEVDGKVCRGVRVCDRCHIEKMLMIYSVSLGTEMMWEPFDTDDVGYICDDCYLAKYEKDNAPTHSDWSW